MIYQMVKHSDIASTFQKIKSFIIQEDTENTDLNVSFDGAYHGNKGFSCTISNVENVAFDEMDAWKEYAKKIGIFCEVESDYQTGTIKLDCTYGNIKKSFDIFYWVYLSAWVATSVELCRLHNLW